MKMNLSKRQIWMLAGAFLVNGAAYLGGRLISQGFRHFSLVTPWDLKIPLLSWTVLIYLGCYLFWIVNYCISVKVDQEKGYHFFAAHCIGEVICFLFFVFFPTSMVRPEIEGTTVFDWLLRLTYFFDAADNLFPSIHCFVSWLCWIGVRGKKEIPKWYRIVSLLMAVFICISTLTVKQHVIADVPAGIALAELSYFLSGKILGKRNEKI